MDAPLQYSPSHPIHGPHSNGRLSGQSFSSTHRSPIPATRRAEPKLGRPVTPNLGHDGSQSFDDLPEITEKNERSYMTRAQKYRLRLKNHFLAMIGEFVGTVLFTFFAFGGAQVANIPSTSITGSTTTANSGSTNAATAQAPNTSSLQFIALSFGFSLTVNAWVFFRISGGLFNPAISLGLALVGVITPIRAALLSVAQCLGAITGAALIQCLLPGPLYITTRLSATMSPVRGLFLEMFLTAMLMLTIFLLAAEKSKTTFLAPVGIGLALFITQLVGVYYTGGAVNPARSLGPDVVIRQFPHYAWIYYVGPILGTILAAGFYKMMKVLHYETVTPDADAEAEAEATMIKNGKNPNMTSSGPKMDSIQGPGIGDYSAKGHNLGPDLESSRAPGTKYDNSVPTPPAASQY